MMITDNNTTAVTFMKRSQSSPKDIFVGCLKTVLVVEFDGSKFSKLMYIPQYHAGIVIDMSIHGRYLLTIAKGDDNLGLIEFDHTL